MVNIYWGFAGSSQRKTAAMLDSDDTDSVSSSSTIPSDFVIPFAMEDVQLNKESVLDQSLDDLFEKR